MSKNKLTPAAERANRPIRSERPKPPSGPLTAEELLGLHEIEIREVDMDQYWPGRSVYLRELTVSERDVFERESLKRIGRGKKTRFEPTFHEPTVRLLVRCLCDKGGKLLFKMSQMSELTKLGAAPMNYLWRVARDMNGLADDEDEREKN